MMTRHIHLPPLWEEAAGVLEKGINAVEGGIVDFDIDDINLATVLDLDDTGVMDLVMNIETSIETFIPQEFVAKCKTCSARGWIKEINAILVAKESLSFVHH